MMPRAAINDRHPEVRALSAFTRVCDALWRASKGDGPALDANGGRPPSRLGRRQVPAPLAPQDDGRCFARLVRGTCTNRHTTIALLSLFALLLPEQSHAQDFYKGKT